MLVGNNEYKSLSNRRFMKRLYYLTDGNDCCEQITSEMHRWGIADLKLHLIDNSEGETSSQQNGASDLPFGVVKESRFSQLSSSALGGVSAAVIAMTLGLPLVELTGQLSFLFLICTLAVAGACCGAALNAHQHKLQLRNFGEDIDTGKSLLVIDCRKDQVQLVRKIVEQRADVLPASKTSRPTTSLTADA